MLFINTKEGHFGILKIQSTILITEVASAQKRKFFLMILFVGNLDVDLRPVAIFAINAFFA